MTKVDITVTLQLTFAPLPIRSNYRAATELVTVPT